MDTRRDKEVEAVRTLMAERGLTMKALSLAGGKNETYVQQFIKYAKPQRLHRDFCEAVAARFGLDPNTLTGSAIPPDAVEVRHTPNTLTKDIPVMGNGTGGPDGAFNMDGPVDYMRRPPGLSGAREVYAVFVTGESMEPRYFSGEPVFVSPTRPVGIGDHVVVQCVNDDGTLQGFVKAIDGRGSRGWKFRQYNPSGIWKPPGPVHSVHRIFTNTDLYLI